MICSACGYENQAGNRFCGMCGIPMPHRPLTAPGAQGTHSLTRVPVEAARPAERPPTAATSSETTVPSRTGVAIEVRSTESRGGESSQPAKVSPSRPDMVPEVPLDEYVKNFRYIPPADPEEFTMRGDTQESQPKAPITTNLPRPAPATNGTVGAANTVAPLPTETTEDVGERLGLEQPGERSSSPRFLDIAGLPPPRKPATRASGIAGPSLLGLNDPPEINTETGDPVEVIRTRILQDSPGSLDRALRGHWRVWLAVAIVLLLAGAGFLMWCSLVQSNKSPGAATKTKIQEVWQDIQGAPAEVPPVPAVGSADAVSYSKTASEEPSKAPPQTAAVPSDTNPSSDVSKPLAADTSAPNANPLDAGASQPVPGADEVARANNASDSAAAAAWLWKATAKGNPDAPVRLADRYIKGDGVPRSCEQALVLLKTAATKENAKARSRLAALYTNGTCVQQNNVEAYRWLNSALAADPNSHWAQENRELIWKQMTADERAAVQR